MTDHLTFFEHQLRESNSTFWQRLGPIDFRGKSVLDVGCGHGALSVHAALNGAASVVGIDIDAERIEFARFNLQQRYASCAGRVRFMAGGVQDCDGRYDIVVSKDTFEHVEDLESTMQAIAARMADGGLLAVGFGPLYFSPFGDHDLYWGSRRYPWSPVWLPEPLLMRWVSRRRGMSIRKPIELGLNQLTPTQFRRIVRAQGWRVASLRYNVGERFGLGAMRLLRKVPPLEKYFTVNIYARLHKPG
jgi:SAM-dependent methyltransferase